MDNNGIISITETEETIGKNTYNFIRNKTLIECQNNFFEKFEGDWVLFDMWIDDERKKFQSYLDETDNE